METITLPKTKYDILRKRASLYERFVRVLPKRKWGVENYTPERIREFMTQDKLDRKTAARVKKLVNSLE